MSTTSPSPSLIESTVAGLLAGVASTVRSAVTFLFVHWPDNEKLVAHPLDVIKTRLQGTSRFRTMISKSKSLHKITFSSGQGFPIGQERIANDYPQ